MVEKAQGSAERAFSFLPLNKRQMKPRTCGVTEIRGPYYTPMGKRYLEDVLETVGTWVDALKFAGGSFSLMPRSTVKELLELCHRHDVLVSTGGFIERVLSFGAEAVERYIRECKDLGFDIIEISSGFISIPTDDWLRMVDALQKAGLKAEDGSGNPVRGWRAPPRPRELEAEGTRDTCWAIAQARRLYDPGIHDYDRIGRALRRT